MAKWLGSITKIEFCEWRKWPCAGTRICPFEFKSLARSKPISSTRVVSQKGNNLLLPSKNGRKYKSTVIQVDDMKGVKLTSHNLTLHWVLCWLHSSNDNYSVLFNTSHGVLIREILNFPQNPFIPAWSLRKSLPCLLLHPGLNLFLLLESNDNVIVTSTEGCCVLYFNLFFE